MQNLGQVFKQRRIELGYSLKAMSEKTKVPVAKLEAIENGDFKYFENDMSYLKFYVRYYSNALHLNYEDFKDEFENSLEQFSNTTKMLKQVEFEEINSRINAHKKTSSKISKKRIDFSFVSFVTVVAVLILGLAFVFILMILPNLNNTNDPLITDDQRDVPEEIDSTPTPTEEVVETTETILIEKVGVSDYQIKQFVDQQEIQLLINFKYNAYFSLQVDGVYSLNPASQLFSGGTNLDMKLNAKDQQVVEFYIGYMAGSIITIENQVIELDESIVNREGKVTFTFTFIGDAS